MTTKLCKTGTKFFNRKLKRMENWIIGLQIGFQDFHSIFHIFTTTKVPARLRFHCYCILSCRTGGTEDLQGTIFITFTSCYPLTTGEYSYLQSQDLYIPTPAQKQLLANPLLSKETREKLFTKQNLIALVINY